ncbi:type VII secretion-associated serine protease mycosin [Actinoplanes sp. NPDC049681]|uniref:type VII secretion-associated serine protease mycosin n=1 Tax=Actinoplanes sp. NPDC049681 TaxID=3363905 RepID=UPI00378AA67B
MRHLAVRLGAACLAAGLTAVPALAGLIISGEVPASSSAGVGALAEAVTAPEPLRGDSIRSEQWHLKTLNVAGAWTYSSGEGVTVAVIDSGVDAGHVDLQGQVLKGLDLVDPQGDGDTDLVGHGTTVSAIIAGRGDDDSGVVGIAPKAKILPVRVLDRENRYDDAMIVAKGVRWAVDNGARVINLSLGGNGSSPALAAALDYAFAKDVVVVACTGNVSASTSSGVWYPAREPGVIAVAGMEKDGNALWSGSITGKETVVTAPATELVGARPDPAQDGYWHVQGTSFAAPMVSATAALIRSRWPTMSAAEVVNRIIKTARDRGPQGRDSQFGYGMVDPAGALTAEVPTVIRNPLDTTASPGIARFGNAPASGQAQSAPEHATKHTTGAQAPGSNAGTAIASGDAGSAEDSHGWWAAVALFLVSAVAAAVTVRRFAAVT